MPVTITVTRQLMRPGESKVVGTLTIGSAASGVLPYVTGGIPVTANEFHLGDANFDLRLFPTTTGHVVGYDKTNRKIKVYTQGVTIGGTAAGALSNGGLALNDAGVEGTSRIATSAASDVIKYGPLLEVSASVDLSAVPFQFEATGAY
jgi:hypothetical protein